jgi:hypothetical protein
VCPPPKIDINRGDYFKATTSVNILTEAVEFVQPPRLIDINRGGYITMPVSVKH